MHLHLRIVRFTAPLDSIIDGIRIHSHTDHVHCTPNLAFKYVFLNCIYSTATRHNRTNLQRLPTHPLLSKTIEMSENNNVEDWRKVTGIGTGQKWGATTQQSTDGRAWGIAISQSVNESKPPPSKGLNAAAPSFTPGSVKSKT